MENESVIEQGDYIRMEESVESDELVLDFLIGRPLEMADLKTLVTDPVTFFKSQINLARTQWIVLIVCLYSLQSNILDLETDTVWIYFTLRVFFSACVIWLISGWWFNVCIKWSVIQPVSKLTGRLIFLYNKLLLAIPATILGIIIFVVKEQNNDDIMLQIWLSIAMLVIVIALDLLTCYNTVITLKGLYKVKSVPLFFWFLGLPILLYSGIIINFLRIILKAF